MGWIIDLLKDVPLSAVIREKLLSAEQKIALLESENANLQSQVHELRQEIQRRDDIIQKEKSHDALLEEIKDKILLFLHKHGDVSLDHLAQSLNIKNDVATMHLKELFSKDMTTTVAVGRSVKWHLQPKGTRYLVDHKLISQPENGME
jgi:predicted HTH transcriptional regulator